MLALALLGSACAPKSSVPSSPPPAPTTTTPPATTPPATTPTTTTPPATVPPVTTGPPPPVTTSTTSVPTPTTTTTTTPPRETVVIEGELAAPLEAIVTDLYRWIADDRNPAPDVPEDLLAHLAAAEIPSQPWRTAQAVTAELQTGESVAIIHVDGDILFAADEGGGWKVVGTAVAGTPIWLGAEPKFLLVLGSDARPGQTQTRFRADSIHILALAPSLDAGTIVGFPRDTYITADILAIANKTVELSNPRESAIKWTNLMSRRGPEIMLATARVLTGLPISGYVVTGFRGFDGLIRAIGGIVVDLPRGISTGSEEPNFSSGRQRLDAARTLLLARIRKTIPGGDFARSQNQGLIILAAMVMVQNRGVDALPDLLKALHNNAWTDLPAGELLVFAAAGLLMDPGGLQNLVLPGSVRTINGSSVVLLNEEEKDRVISEIAPDGVLDPASEEDG